MLADLLGDDLAAVAVALGRDGVAYVAKKAVDEWCDCDDPGCAPAMPVRRGPPADWSALAKQRCWSCDEGCSVYHCCVGSLRPGGVVSWDNLCDRHFNRQGFRDCDGCCSACAGSGKARHELRVPCRCACHRLKSAYPGISHDVLGGCKRDGSCIDGTVSYTVVVDLVPYSVFSVTQLVIGDPSPGDYVAVIRKVET